MHDFDIDIFAKKVYMFRQMYHIPPDAPTLDDRNVAKQYLTDLVHDPELLLRLWLKDKFHT